MRSRRQRRGSGSGFTLVELMIVVAIIGILAAIAIPSFSKYIKRSRTTEAYTHLNKVWAASVIYYESDQMDTNTPATALPHQFPGPSALEATPGNLECGCLPGGKCPGGSSSWDADPVFKALSFVIADPHSYRPAYASSGTGMTAQFTGSAMGDLDCDGTLSTFIRRGGVDPINQAVSGSNAQTVYEELE